MTLDEPVRVLVVDDDPDILNGTARLLEKAGYAVARAASGEAALLAIEEQGPELILLARALPGIDGIEVCRRIKREPTLNRPIALIQEDERTITGSPHASPTQLLCCPRGLSRVGVRGCSLRPSGVARFASTVYLRGIFHYVEDSTPVHCVVPSAKSGATIDRNQ